MWCWHGEKSPLFCWQRTFVLLPFITPEVSLWETNWVITAGIKRAQLQERHSLSGSGICHLHTLVGIFIAVFGIFMCFPIYFLPKCTEQFVIYFFSASRRLFLHFTVTHCSSVFWCKCLRLICFVSFFSSVDVVVSAVMRELIRLCGGLLYWFHRPFTLQNWKHS